MSIVIREHAERQYADELLQAQAEYLPQFGRACPGGSGRC